jgi:hypothetical protein
MNGRSDTGKRERATKECSFGVDIRRKGETYNLKKDQRVIDIVKRNAAQGQVLLRLDKW